jgi:hypothetical protein
MCQNAKETIQHLFIECHFAKKTWIQALGNLNYKISWPQSTIKTKNIKRISRTNLFLKDYKPSQNIFVGAFGYLTISKFSMKKLNPEDKLPRKHVPFSQNI